MTRDAVRERLAYESHLARCILVDPIFMGVNSGQLASKKASGREMGQEYNIRLNVRGFRVSVTCGVTSWLEEES